MSSCRRYHAVEDSTTYQYIIEQGGIKAMRRILLRQVTSKLGPPSDNVKAVIQELKDLTHLERMFDRAIDTATSWDEVVETR
jgi:hypothetical protein